MAKKDYRILTDINLYNNNLLNVTTIQGPNFEGYPKDLTISTHTGDLILEAKAQKISLYVDDNSFFVINSKDGTFIKDSPVTIEGTDLKVISTTATIENTAVNIIASSSVKVDTDELTIKGNTADVTAPTFNQISNTSYEVTSSSGFELKAGSAESRVKAQYLEAIKEVDVGVKENGVKIYWDNDSSSVVFSKWS